jgi:hypothetical protein
MFNQFSPWRSRCGDGEEKGVGLYTYEQTKNATPFQYLAQIIVGTIVASGGGLLLYHMMSLRSDEVRMYGSAETHIWGWAVSLAIVIIGLFQAHAGGIFWVRRIAERISFVRKAHNRNRHGGS